MKQKLIAEIIGRLYVKNRRNREAPVVVSRASVIHVVSESGCVRRVPCLHMVSGNRTVQTGSCRTTKRYAGPANKRDKRRKEFQKREVVYLNLPDRL